MSKITFEEFLKVNGFDGYHINDKYKREINVKGKQATYSKGNDIIVVNGREIVFPLLVETIKSGSDYTLDYITNRRVPNMMSEVDWKRWIKNKLAIEV